MSELILEQAKDLTSPEIVVIVLRQTPYSARLLQSAERLVMTDQ